VRKSVQLPFVSSSTNGLTKNFRLHDEQTVDGFKKLPKLLFPLDFFIKLQNYPISMSLSECARPRCHVLGFVAMCLSMFPYACPCFPVPGIPEIHFRGHPTANAKRNLRSKNGNFGLLTADGNGSLFSFVGNKHYCFSKRAHL
jgi:hypothetical protein